MKQTNKLFSIAKESESRPAPETLQYMRNAVRYRDAFSLGIA
jgi:hypothetical protein